jgi:hypothetical protein
VKGLKSVLVKTKGHEKLRTVMLLSSVWWQESDTISYSEERETSEVKSS